MQTNYRMNPEVAQVGQPYGPRLSNPLTLASLAQTDTIVIADASAAAGEAWTLRAVDDETTQSYDIEFLSGVDLPTTLDNMLAALVAHGKANDLFTFTEDGTDTLTPVARHNGRAYTWTAPTVGGSATATITTTVESGGQKLEFGRMVSRNGDGTMRAPASGDAVIDFAGILFRTDGNHFMPMSEVPDPTAYDGADRGRTMEVMEQGRVWVELEAAVTDVTSGVYVRAVATGSEVAGTFRGTADGGDTVDVSAFCRFESVSVTLADGTIIAPLRLTMPG